MDFKDRLVTYARVQHNMGMTNFEKYTGLASGTINKMKKGLSSDSLAKIMTKCPRLNVSWLITGEGSMLNERVETTRVGNVDATESTNELLMRIKRFAASQGYTSISDLARDCGLTQRELSPFSRSGISSRALVKLAAKFPAADIDYLLTGRKLEAVAPATSVDTIPLLPFDAVAGTLSENITNDFSETIPIPTTINGRADFAIRVDGDSMYPRYISGDVLFVKKITDPTFLQWGKVYVLATTQGCIVKRLYPSRSNDAAITCHSENTVNYPDYDIPREEITAVGLVIGHMGVD